MNKMFFYYLQIVLTILVGMCGVTLLIAGICYGKGLVILMGVLGIVFPLSLVFDKKEV